MVFKSLQYFCSMLGPYIGDGSQKTQGMKRKLFEEKDSEGKIAEETETKRIEEEKSSSKLSKRKLIEDTSYQINEKVDTLAMDLSQCLPLDDPRERRIFIFVFKEYSQGGIVPWDQRNYWDTHMWISLSKYFNQKAHEQQLPGRPWDDIIRGGKQLKAMFNRQRAAKRGIQPDLRQIFELCDDCQHRIPIFPDSILSRYSTSNSSGSNSGGFYSGGGGMRGGGMSSNVTSTEELMHICKEMRNQGHLRVDQMHDALLCVQRLYNNEAIRILVDYLRDDTSPLDERALMLLKLMTN